jgi:hypothetical protein
VNAPEVTTLISAPRTVATVRNTQAKPSAMAPAKFRCGLIFIGFLLPCAFPARVILFIIVQRLGGANSGSGQTPLLFYQFSTGRSRLVTRVDGVVYHSLAVSPDRRTILFSKSATSGADLMLIENFR